MKILLAEDDAVFRKLLKIIVESEGHETISASHGGEAWELLKHNRVDMIITDWMMPEMDGIALCKKIREAQFENYIYIILLTAKDRIEDTVSGLEAGADDFIIKPVNKETLCAKIRAGERITRLEEQYKKANAQLFQSEKMASVGQLAAGVAHEINNPTGFVSSNLKTLSDYLSDITGLFKKYNKLVENVKENICGKEAYPHISGMVEEIMALEKEADIDFIIDDIEDLLGDCREGLNRIKNIVKDLKDFAHPGEDKLQEADINKGIESTLNVVANELKYNAVVEKEFGVLPLVKCYSQQLNQVVMNILVNAGQAIPDKGKIWIKTAEVNDFVEIKISDTGIGISEENLSKIFEPFFTTKEVGKGTGLGMNVAYNIVKKHNGTINVDSTVGKGTTFTIRIPVSGDFHETTKSEE